MTKQIPDLSKSRFMAGMQCSKRLYLECFNYNERDPVPSAQQAIFDLGTKVGEIARQRFAGGHLVAEDHTQHDQAISTTQNLLGNKGCPAIYEAAFTYDNIRIRVDILAKSDDGNLDIVEVKASTKVKEEHLWDLAIQLYVLQGLGYTIGACKLMHVNNSYVYDGGEYLLEELFTVADVTDKVTANFKSIPTMLVEMRKPLEEIKPPEREIGMHCKKPYDCSFYDYCHAHLPEDHVINLPRISGKQLSGLRKDGIEVIGDIPPDYRGLTATQVRVRESVIEGRPIFEPDIFSELKSLATPIHFIDFETFNPALPVYKGTRPYQQIPFQWSAHTMQIDGRLLHQDFLAKDVSDPRRPFAESLISALSEGGPIIVYSSFEKTCLNSLTKEFADLADALSGITDRFVDLYTLIRNHTYHPVYNGSFSIKNVLPALVPHLDYKNLNIADGATASTKFAATVTEVMSADEKQRVYDDLLAYCKQDTLAMVEIYKALLNIDREKVSA